MSAPVPAAPPPGDDGRGPILIELADRAIRAGLARPLLLPGADAQPPDQPSDQPPDVSAWLDEPGAAFVTLHVPGPGGRPALRGCIGSLEAYRSLRQDVEANARAAAFRDPRFPPLAAPELLDLQIEVSVLSAPQPVLFASRADLVTRLRPGIDGVILEYGGRRGTYLPQVWEQLPDPSDFLASLVRKAGLPQGFWSDDVKIWRYGVTAYPQPRAATPYPQPRAATP